MNKENRWENTISKQRNIKIQRIKKTQSVNREYREWENTISKQRNINE